MEELSGLIKELAAAQTRTELAVQALAVGQKALAKEVTSLKGWQLEDRYRKHIFAYFGRWLRKAKVIDLGDLAGVVEASANGELSDQEWEHLSALDVLARGIVGKGEQAREVLMALEVSWVIDRSDVERAHNRAATLRRLGYTTLGALGGNSLTAEADSIARDWGVVIVLEGRVQFWPSEAQILQTSGS